MARGHLGGAQPRSVLGNVLRTAFPSAVASTTSTVDRASSALDDALGALHLELDILERQVDELSATMASAGARKLVIEGSRRRIAGASVFFAGADDRARDRQMLATRHGFTVARRLAGTIDLVVIADAGTHDREVARARSLGLPVVREELFWARLGEAGSTAG